MVDCDTSGVLVVEPGDDWLTVASELATTDEEEDAGDEETSPVTVPSIVLVTKDSSVVVMVSVKVVVSVTIVAADCVKTEVNVVTNSTLAESVPVTVTTTVESVTIGEMTPWEDEDEKEYPEASPEDAETATEDEASSVGTGSDYHFHRQLVVLGRK